MSRENIALHRRGAAAIDAGEFSDKLFGVDFFEAFDEDALETVGPEG
jgi:hypothetical protein